MSDPRPRWLRWLARAILRGPDGPYVRADLEEGFTRDLERGRSRGSATRRYLTNACVSALRLVVTGRAFGLGVSWLDVKLGMRMLFKQPALTLVAVFALSIGIPVGLLPSHILTSMTAPPPVPEGHDILLVQNWNTRTSTRVARPLHDFTRWRDELSSFEDLGIAATRSYNLMAEDGRAGPLTGSEVSASVFRILKVQPYLGRSLNEADEVPGGLDVVVLGYDAWRSRLASDPEVVGKTVRIGDVPHTVVGVMPDGFQFPVRDQLWVPFRHSSNDYTWGSGPRGVVLGRLAQGVSLEEATVEARVLRQRVAVESPATHGELETRILPYAEGLMGFDPNNEPEVVLLKGMAFLLLVLACGNVGILILARASTRMGELAVRTALGASRARIVGQIFVESLILALLAAGVGLTIGGYVATRFDEIAATLRLEYWVDFGITPRTIAWALGLAVVSAVIAGVVPALKATGKKVQLTMQRSAGTASGVRFGTASTVLIVAEVAVAVAFLSVTSGLVPNALASSGGLGIETDRYLYAVVEIPWEEPSAEAAEAYEAEHRARVAAAQVQLLERLSFETSLGPPAVASTLPGMNHNSSDIEVEGETLAQGSRGIRVKTARVDVDYFRALDQPILSGRDFSRADLADGTNVIVVNRNFSDRVLNGRNPIGHRVRFTVPEGREPRPWLEIVGVVGALGMNEMHPDADAGLYEVVAPGVLGAVPFAVHVGDDPVSATPRLREIVADIDPTAMVQNAAPLDQVFNGDRFLSRWLGLLFGLIAFIAVVLSAAGLYALMSFTVAQRTREIGIRTALGARPSSIVGSIARRAFAQLTVGVTLGGVLALMLIDQSDNLLVNRGGSWPLVITLTALAMVVVGMLACVSPTRRGLKIRPVEALKG